jgi:hypothetical protein
MTEDYKERVQYGNILFCVSAYDRQKSIFDFPSLKKKIHLLFDICSFLCSVLNMFVYDLTTHAVSRWLPVV